MIFANPSPDELCQLLRTTRSIAVLGLSPNPLRPSWRVARALQQHGYRIVPVRPLLDEVLGEVAYPDLAHIPFTVDWVNVFRAAEHVPAIVDACIALGITRIWLQDGIVHQAAAERAMEAGMTVVMDACIWRDGVARCGVRHE